MDIEFAAIAKYFERISNGGADLFRITRRAVILLRNVASGSGPKGFLIPGKKIENVGDPGGAKSFREFRAVNLLADGDLRCYEIEIHRSCTSFNFIASEKV